MSDARGRPIGFSAVLVLLATGSVAGAVSIASGHVETLADLSSADAVVKALYYSIPFLNLVSLTGLWLWRWWAVWLTALLAVLGMSIEVYLAMPLVHLARVPIVFSILMLLVARHRSRFR